MNGKMTVDVPTTSKHRLVRYLGAVLSGATGVLYLLVGLGVTSAGGDNRARILLGAATVFFVLAASLPLLSRRSVYLLGVALQVVVIIGYFVIAPSRTPHYTGWGIIIKVLEVLLLGVLVYLLARRAPRGEGQTSGVRRR